MLHLKFRIDNQVDKGDNSIPFDILQQAIENKHENFHFHFVIKIDQQETLKAH